MIWYNVGMAKYMENLVGCNGSCRWRLTIWVSFEALSGNLRKVEGIWGTCNDIINENLRIARGNFAAVLCSAFLPYFSNNELTIFQRLICFSKFQSYNIRHFERLRKPSYQSIPI